MPKIHVLSPQLASKIAAGEVIERPASVVKELLENAIDAQARHIEVQIEEGGKSLIRVVDNGSGMEPEEVLLALERHATSKLEAEEDLWNLNTLGFRGEALPSIAAVSRFTLMSRARGASSGLQVIVEGGELKNAQEVGLPPGTRVEVTELFYNVPARKKFLKSEATETGKIVEMVENLALAYPSVHFRLLEKNKVLLNLNPTQERWQRWGDILGGKAQETFLTIEEIHPELELSGLLCRPDQSKSSWSNMRLLANQRPIKDRSLYQALLLAYGTLLSKGRYPQGVLSLRMDPAQVDVNVHPTKAEVRFAEPGKIFSFVTKALSKRLSSFLPQAFTASPAELGGEVSSSPKAIGKQFSPAISPTLYKETKATSLPAIEEETIPLFRPQAAFTSWLQGAQAVGQFHGTYIIAQNQDYLFLIDQHAAHERIIFERLQKEWEHNQAQELLYPLTWEVNSQEALCIERCREILARMGFTLEPFGTGSFLLRSCPPILQPEEALPYLQEVLDKILSGEITPDFSELFFAFLAAAACHGAQEAHQAMSLREMQALLDDLMKTERPNACPHGRPTVLEYPLEEIRRRFKRTR